MSLRAARRNARRATNYNLEGKLPMTGETMAQAFVRGEALARAAAHDMGELDDNQEKGHDRDVDQEQLTLPLDPL